ncbi:glycerol-3-phosphate dehydrogenase/oxidase [Allofranklinella schreckenbergeri]|uniref:Glycerol-3-phosphate dehydrogenase/oxidase n=1 Tax=Allofranklinella schreckenbergeri TaxID=1076744 RepID=A0A3M6R211_9BURK|nr:glycerol-3-phosphate dehydrogenase/oxidase [Allofranklinella schreckenbergeri]RMX09233.1 glycerol-3-phosphate dehydrogenase/oxidase [Allofranklinella schreckenbergeri]RRD42467.1 FAD-dependent oxidoreductase [Comamonadaceae bacterium OH3737_COT-264]
MTLATQAPLPTQRPQLLRRLADTPAFDVLVIGGGATGLGVALDAVTRGLSVALVEAHDFAKGTSSRATKLVHGGVRYLAQGNVALVREALHERAALLENAPHLAQRLPFIMPSYKLWETPFYGTGLRMYDALAGRDGLGATQCLSRERVQALAPNVLAQGLRGGVLYWDGQFDDARLALALARTAAQHGAQVLNYLRVEQLLHASDGRVCGAEVVDQETHARFAIQATCVINATGVWVDALRQLDEAGRQGSAAVPPMVSPSQGTHIVVDRQFWPGEHALLVPKTRDGRVLFAVPWLGSVILGTTDRARSDLPLEPRPQAEEIGFILQEAARYLAQPPKLEDVRSSWAGMRPLVRPVAADGSSTKTLSREHTIHTSASGMVTVTGGKWTTYRAMAEDVIRHAQLAGVLPAKLPPSQTRHLPLVGSPQPREGAMQAAAMPQSSLHSVPGLAVYGSEADYVRTLQGSDVELSPAHQLSEAMVRYAVRHEYARSVEDVLARRSRLLFLDAKAAAALAPRVAQIMGEELGHSVDAAVFQQLAQQYADAG